MSNIENDLDSLIEAIHSAVSEATTITEQQHIQRLRKFFNDDGTAKTMNLEVKSLVPGKDKEKIEVPLICLAPMNSIAIDELEIELSIRMSKLLNGRGFDKKKKSIGIDFTSFLPSSKERAKLKIKFKGRDVPEGFARVIENFIKTIP